MKKTWLFKIALALGVSHIPGAVYAQYGAVPFGNGALAPSGYAVPENMAAQRPVVQPVAMPVYANQMNGVAQLPQYVQQPGGQVTYAQQAFTQQPYVQAQPQYIQAGTFQNGVPAQTVAYPQETIPAPGFNAQQAPEAGWVGPNNGQYQAVPQNTLPQQSNAMGQAPSSILSPSPSPVPMSAPMSGPMVGSVQNVGPGCNGGYSMPAYGGMLAPTATAPYMGGSCGSGGCGAPVYGGNTCGPIYAGPIFQGAGFGGGGGWFSNRGSIPGRAFFAGGGALLMRRVDDHNVPLTYNTNMPTESTLGTRDARQDHLNGFEVFGGRYFNCGRNAIMLSYWGLFPEDRTAQVDAAAAPSAYRSRYHFNGIQMPTQSAYDWYDGAISHRIVRSSEYHNFEGNLLGFAVGGAARTWGYGGGGGGCGIGRGFGAFGAGSGYASCGSGGCGTGGCGTGYSDCGSCYSDCGSCGSGAAAFTGPCGLTPAMCGSRFNWTWLAGLRWFRFTDNLQYSASETDYAYNGGVDDLYYDNNVRNDLVGFQLGGVGTYCLGSRFNVYGLSKAGIYNNHSTLYTRIGRNGGGPTATIDWAPANAFQGDAYMVDASQNNAAFLGELGTGVGVRVSRGWSANVGYRVIGVSGVATAVNTIPIEMVHLGNVADYNTTSSLLLHGISIGGMYNF